MRKALGLVMFGMLLSSSLLAQNLVWTGSADTDFFNESNWLIEGTEDQPADGALEDGTSINYDLTINNAELVLSSNISLSFGTDNGLTFNNSSFELGEVTAGYLKLTNYSTLILLSETPLGTDATIQIEDNQSWIKLPNVDPTAADPSQLEKITSNGEVLTNGENATINQYYYQGSLIRLKDANVGALTLFDGVGQSGDSFTISPFDIYARNELGDFENKASSFRLERGYMATMTIFQNGTGKSEVYVASEDALEVDLPTALNNTVSYVRVMPWNWVTKKGASKFIEVGTTWTYNWNRTGESLPNIEYVPMSWGGGGASSAVVTEYIAMENVTHLLGFNESDNCNGQSGQYGDLCKIEVAVPLYKNLMRSGLRLVSPSPREGGPFGWLKNFRDLAVESDVRYDVLGVHWYDWGSNPANRPFEDPQAIFNRFKDYLDRVYEEHQMPIWLTEFNANANRDVSVHQGFMELALPYLESLDFIERYDYFEPSEEVANNREDIEFAKFYDTDGNITPFGIFYRDFESTPAIPEATFAGSGFLSGLDGKVQLQMEVSKSELAEGESLTITFATDRSVGAAESFTIEITGLDEEQYSLSSALIEISEGARSAEVTLTAFDDELVEEIMNGSISLTSLSSGIDWSDSPIGFSIESEDIEVEVPLSVEDLSIKLYPNPTDRFITVDMKSSIDSISIISLDGKKVEDVPRNGNTIDLNGIKPGVYIVKFTLMDGRSLEKTIQKN